MASSVMAHESTDRGPRGWAAHRSRRARSRPHWATRWLAIALVLGCGDSSTAPPTGDVARLILSPEAAAVPVGESRPLTLSFQNAAGAELPPVAGVFWSSSNPDVAAVTQEGVVTAVALGESQVAASLAGTSATARISVVPQPVATVQVSPATVSLRVAQTAALSVVTLSAANATLTGRAITWSTTNADVAGVSDAGVVTAVAPGTARITATSEGVSGGADVTVSPATLASITVTPNRPTVGVGQSVVLAAVLVDELGAPVTGRSVTWSTADAGIASVGADGRVTGVKPGAATISAGLDGVVGSATVTVTAGPVSQVTISPATASVTVAQAVTLTATLRDAGGNVVTGQPVSWRSNASGVATVTSGGVARGVSPGTAIITATVGSNSGSAVLTVTAVPVASIAVAPSPATVRVGETVKLDATPRAADGSALTGRVVQWSSSNESRAIVSSSGLVRGVSPGGVTITARSEGKSGTSAVSPRDPGPRHRPDGSSHRDRARCQRQSARESNRELDDVRRRDRHRGCGGGGDGQGRRYGYHHRRERGQVRIRQGDSPQRAGGHRGGHAGHGGAPRGPDPRARRGAA